MNEFTLHNFRRCPFCIRTRIVLFLKKIPHTIIEERLRDWTDWMIEHVPDPRVPILIHNGKIIRESNQINLYLEKLFPEPELCPAENSAEYQEMEHWWTWFDTDMKPLIDRYKYGETKEDREMAETQLRQCLGKIESVLADKPNLLGENLSLADIAIIPFIRQIKRTRGEEFDWRDFPQIIQWADQILQQDWFESEVMKKWEFAKPKS